MASDLRYGVAGATRGLGEMDTLGLSPDAYCYQWDGLPESELVQMVARPVQDGFWGAALNPNPPPYFYANPFKGPDDMQDWVQANPGKIYIVGNEPDKADQDNLPPAQYAELYRKVHHWIKTWDDTAKVATCGVSQDGWTSYLQAVIDADGMTPNILHCDIWTMHYYANGPAEFKNTVAEFRSWRDSKPN